MKEVYGSTYVRHFLLMSIFKNKTFMGAMSILLAALIAFVAIPMVNKATRSTREVVRLVEPVAENVQITAAMLTVVEVGDYNLPEGVISDPNSIIGKYAATDLMVTDNLVPTKFKDYRSATDEFLYDITNDNLVAVSVTVGDLQTQVSGKLQENDIVSIYVVGRSAETGEYGAVLHDELRYMRIDALVNSSGEDVTASNNKLISSIVFSCTEAQARKLITLQSTGALYIVHVGRGEDAIELYKNYSYNIPGTRVGVGSSGSNPSNGGGNSNTGSVSESVPPSQPTTPASPSPGSLLPSDDSPLMMQ